MDFTILFGLGVGLSAFLIIGLFHPVVIKAHYHWGTGCWWIFLLLGLIAGALSIYISNQFFSAILGVFAFSSLWTIKELFEQEGRVARGWFPENPKRVKK